jgi:hypothetical protein
MINKLTVVDHGFDYGQVKPDYKFIFAASPANHSLLRSIRNTGGQVKRSVDSCFSELSCPIQHFGLLQYRYMYHYLDHQHVNCS